MKTSSTYYRIVENHNKKSESSTFALVESRKGRSFGKTVKGGFATTDQAYDFAAEKLPFAEII